MISGATIGFYLLAIVAILASLRVITRTNPVHALLNMIVTLLALSGIFFALGAPFAGALEIIVYAGAIMVLFVFVVMMLNLGTQSTLEEESWLASSAWAVPAGLARMAKASPTTLWSATASNPTATGSLKPRLSPRKISA